MPRQALAEARGLPPALFRQFGAAGTGETALLGGRRRAVPYEQQPCGRHARILRVCGRAILPVYTRVMFPVSDVIPSRRVPFVTIGLIIVNALVFLYQVTLSPVGLELFVGTYALIPAWFWWPSLFTSQFLHAGWMHFIWNMVYLWIFGDNVEDRLGHGRYLLFYLGGGAAAAILQTLFNPFSAVPMLGASGAIAAVMGAYFVLYPQSRVLTAIFLVIFFDLVEVPALFFLGTWFLLQLVSGLGSLGVSNAAGGGTAFLAHIGGFAVGALVGAVLRKRDRRWE